MSDASDSSVEPRKSVLLLRLRKSLAKALKERTGSVQTNLSFYDLNELPYVSQMRSLLLILCASTFMIAPIAYMPLGQIQLAYDQKCFLYTDLRIRSIVSSDNKSDSLGIIAVDPVATQWGPTSSCDVTTFIPVSMSIFSIIVGMSTFTIWPTLMSLGRGGALMMSYTFVALLGLAACSISISFLHFGYKDTCEKLQLATMNMKNDGYSCSSLNNIDIMIPEVRLNYLSKNVNRVMVVAKIIHWCLLGLMFGKVCVSVLTFEIIWLYVNSK